MMLNKVIIKQMMSIKGGKEKDEISFRSETQGEAGSQQYAFCLEPIVSNARFTSPVKYDFCPAFDQSRSNRSTIPRFNKDGLYHTPSFVTSQDEALDTPADYLRSLRAGEREKGQVETTDLLVPKPSSSFCQVCRVKFPDYLKHIRSTYHQKRLSSSYFQKQIKKFIEQFPNGIRENKKQVVISNPQEVSEFALSTPKKRIKASEMETKDQVTQPKFNTTHQPQLPSNQLNISEFRLR